MHTARGAARCSPAAEEAVSVVCGQADSSPRHSSTPLTDHTRYRGFLLLEMLHLMMRYLSAIHPSVFIQFHLLFWKCGTRPQMTSG